jgi:mannose-1-phosphate guanylyltransferase
VGSPASLRQAERWKLQEIAFTSITGDVTLKTARIQGPVQLGASISVGFNSRIIGPVAIGGGTTIGDNTLIGPYTSIGESCHIKSNVKIFSSSIYNRVIIGRNTTISGSIIDNDTIIGTRCSIENDTVIGPRVVLRDDVVVHSRTRIWPEVVVPDRTVVKEHVLNEKFDLKCEGS